MLHFLPSFLLGPLALWLIVVNVLIVTVFGMYPVSLLKRWSRSAKWNTVFSKWLEHIVNAWHYANDYALFLTQKIEWDLRGLEFIPEREWILVLSNHRSWVDILVLFHCLHRKAPFIKYFLKQQLRKIPVMGYNWEALDYPFLDRYSRKELAENPQLLGQDLERVGQSCRKFNRYPVCIIAFPEGTRFSLSKRRKQDSPYQNLLKPRAGGVAMALQEMKGNLKSLLDLTILYDQDQVSFWDFLSGKVRKITVVIRPLPVPAELIALDYINDPAAREKYQVWLNEVWQDKDVRIQGLISDS